MQEIAAALRVEPRKAQACIEGRIPWHAGEGGQGQPGKALRLRPGADRGDQPATLSSALQRLRHRQLNDVPVLATGLATEKALRTILLVSHYPAMARSDKCAMLRGTEHVFAGDPLQAFAGKEGLRGRTFDSREQVCVVVAGATEGGGHGCTVRYKR
ncbi:hypothetical protein D3C76_1022960 [compost metagenome]